MITATVTKAAVAAVDVPVKIDRIMVDMFTKSILFKTTKGDTITMTPEKTIFNNLATTLTDELAKASGVKQVETTEDPDGHI